MPLNKNVRSCTHIKVNGVRCDSPPLRGEVFCYFHQRMIRGVNMPPKSRLHPIALIEDGRSIQVSLMEVINALVRNTIDLRRAQLILRALHIAVKNSPRVHFDLFENQMVSEVPAYPAAPELQRPDPAFNQARVLARPKLPKPVGIDVSRAAFLAASADPTRNEPLTSAPAGVRPAILASTLRLKNHGKPEVGAASVDGRATAGPSTTPPVPSGTGGFGRDDSFAVGAAVPA